MTIKEENIFEFSWEECSGLDLHMVEWESRIMAQEFNPSVLELSQALYSSFSELRKIHKIMKEGKPGIEHSYYQFRFELFAHNHFLSIATGRVMKILKIGFPDVHAHIHKSNILLIKQVKSYRDSLEHQTEIGRGKKAPKFFNNLSDKGFVSQNNVLPYAEIEKLLNHIMVDLENNLSSSGQP